MIRWPRGGAVLRGAALAATITGRIAAQEPARGDTLEHAPLTLVYRPYVRTIIGAVHRRGSFYLPLGETLTRLEIEHVIDLRLGAASGRAPGERAEFRIDLRAGTAMAGRRRLALDPESFFVTELELFVLPAVLERLLGVRSAIDSHMLAVEITSAEELPVAESFRRRERHALFTASSASSDAPLRYDRQRRGLDGAVLQYSVAGESRDDAQMLRFDIAGGGELLGGDLQASLRGSRGDGWSSPDEGDWRWRWVAGGRGRALSQVTLGRLFSSGLAPTDMEGIEITNRPVQPRTRLGSRAIEGITEPNAEVALYIDDRLAGIARADPFGQYRFELPLRYGTSIVRVESYGTSGGVHRDERALQIPFALVPSGRADYEIEAGRSRLTGTHSMHGRVAVGLTNRLTSSLGIDFGGSDSLGGWVTHGGLSALFGSGHVVALDVAPHVLYRASWDGVFPSRANLRASVTRFGADSWVNRGAAADEWIVHGYLPLGARAAGGMLQGDARHRRRADGHRTSVARVTAATRLGFVRPLVGYDWMHVVARAGAIPEQRAELKLGLFTHPLRHRVFPRWLRSTRLSGWRTHDVASRDVRHSQVSLSAPFARSVSFDASFQRDHLAGRSRFDLLLVLDHAYSRSTTGMSASGEQSLFTQRLSGAVGYDSRSRSLVLDNRAWAGQAAVVMRCFLDANGNGRLDAGEQPVRGAWIRLNRAVEMESAGPGVVRAVGLPAYERVTATVDASGVRNPLWMPAAPLFSFITDPNRYKSIDVPFFAAGIMEGTVVRRVGVEERAVPGLRLRLRRTDGALQADVPTFSDGSFYHMGLPPGRYTLEPDPAQLELLGVRAEPATRHFEVRQSAGGDLVERLDFVLVPRF